MIDCHVHLITEQPQEFADTLVARMDAFGVSQAVIFGTPDPTLAGFNRAEVLEAARRYPGRLIPFDCSLDFADEGSADEMIAQLETGAWKGVGEIFLNNQGHETITWTARDETIHEGPHFPYPPEGGANKAYARVFSFCGQRGLPVMAHCLNEVVMADCLQMYPRTPFIWAHADWWVDPGKVRALLERHPNLYCDFGTGLRAVGDEWASGTAGDLHPDRADAWRQMAATFPDRLVWGSDIFEWTHLQPECYSGIWRTWAGFAEGLDQRTKELIACENMQRLLGRGARAGPAQAVCQEEA